MKIIVITVNNGLAIASSNDRLGRGVEVLLIARW